VSDGFKTTRWTIVVAAAESSPDGRRAFEKLCESYWYPLYAFVRRRGYDASSAQDLTQSFFLRVMEKGYLDDLDPSAGKFRAYLLASIKHFLSNERSRSAALKRRADDPSFTISLDGAEEIYRKEAHKQLNAEQLFERQWALTVLGRAIERLQGEYESSGRAELFDRLKGFVTGDSEGKYSDAAAALGMTEGAVKTAVHRLRRRLGKVLRDEVTQTLASPEQLDDEIRHLLHVVS